MKSRLKSYCNWTLHPIPSPLTPAMEERSLVWLLYRPQPFYCPEPWCHSPIVSRELRIPGKWACEKRVCEKRSSGAFFPTAASR